MKHIRKYIALILCMTTILCLAGCTYTSEVVEKDTTSTTLEPMYDDDQTSVTEKIAIPGEDFRLVCTYDTNDYPLNEWRVTSNKTINMTVKTEGLPEGYTVHIEHVHADIVLRATTPQVDGITQDSMDDSDHRIPTSGFPVSDTVTYNNLFAIEGYTDQFYTLWGYACGSYGSVSSSYHRMTEGNIRKAGAYGEELMVVYDIIITPPDETEGYVRSVYSEVMIPLVSEIEYIQKDLLTGETIPQTEESTENNNEE